ncbi:NACHT, LRR and PYD domains-containing protein 3-like [Salminus brasiliensis]|uniref:NACHT, LRR and PYD domains-containing protein 3-like n=1 Tax=Salminus brasiliensis TaxID=930266 RepID=UPI003B837700
MSSKMSVSGEQDTQKDERLVQDKRTDSPEPSCVSMKSDQSMEKEINFREDNSSTELRERADLPEPSCVSMKSDQSMEKEINFREDNSSTELRDQQGTSGSNIRNMEFILKELEYKVISLVKNQLKKFVKLLNPECSEKEVEKEDDQCGVREGALKITLHVLRNMNQTDLANTLQSKLAPFCHQKFQSKLRGKFHKLIEGISNPGASTLLNEIYTELYITEGGSGEVNNEHEVRQITAASRRPATQETPIKCNNIFTDKSIRTVLTKGVAGIGKTVSVQKFILDWTEEKANQDVHFIFPLPFRELNLMKKKKFSLEDLLHQFFTDTKDLQPRDYYRNKIIFIFDGLDECRLPLDFQNNESLSDVAQSASVDVLLTNLIKGNLLPSALLWITTRPAAASQVPPDYIDQVTEVRGFNDPQKEEYFRKRISDQRLAGRIITHMRSSRSLYIMCHIPVFCWIAATVLERMLGEAKKGEIPKTLTQMFTHFLIFQIKHSSQKYQERSDVDQTRKIILALGKLAFQQLEKGNLIFYEEDLKECGIDVREVSVYSGVCTQIFREEFGLQLGRVFSFVHLSVQEFLAALYAFLIFKSEKQNVLLPAFCLFKKSKMSHFLKSAVDKALQSENGHLDLFLCFLLGLSLQSNQNLLRGLLTQTENSSHTKEDIVKYIKEMVWKNLSTEKTVSLFHCLNELDDHSLVQEVQTYLDRGGPSGLSRVKLTPAQWSAVAFLMLNSEEELNEFDLRKFDISEQCLLRLLPVVKASRNIMLNNCSMSEDGCVALVSALKSNPSHLRVLNLNHNNPGESGVKLLCDLLKDPCCKLESLQLSECSIREEGCAALVSALRLNPSHLRELNLSSNKIGESGVKLLSDLLKNSWFKVENLQLADCSITQEGCVSLISALKSNPSHLRELNLNYNNPGESGVKLLCDLLNDAHFKLEKLQLCACNLTEKSVFLTSAFSSNSSHLRELNLGNNKLQDSGVKLLSAGLRKPQCKLKKLLLNYCRITEEGCTALVSALKSNPSHLRELNLNSNKPGESGVKLLSDLLKAPRFKLEKLLLCWCNLTDTSCRALASALSSKPLSLRELDLSYNELQDSGVKLLSAALVNPDCKLETLGLRCCDLTEKSCAALASALSLNLSLRELVLSSNDLQDSGVKLLTAGLGNPHCKLERLELEFCRVTEEGCAALVSALKSNPSHLRELNLTSNKPGESGVKLLSDLVEDRLFKLEKLHST